MDCLGGWMREADRCMSTGDASRLPRARPGCGALFPRVLRFRPRQPDISHLARYDLSRLFSIPPLLAQLVSLDIAALRHADITPANVPIIFEPWSLLLAIYGAQLLIVSIMHTCIIN
jgi:hypothetical protein